MDKLSKKILKYMVKNGKGISYSCSISEDWNDYADTSLSALAEAIKADEDTVLAAVEYLTDEGNGYLEYCNMDASWGPHPIGFRLTHRGLHHKEFEREAVRTFIMQSILTPIVVSAITALITLWLNGVFN